jgi:AAA+ ATPase superfamily predicted ATPase
MLKKIFIGRKKELEKLSLLLNKKSASLAVIRGRRRIGKSYLVKEFGRQCIEDSKKKCRFLSFAGLPPTELTTAESQREEFSKQLSRQLGIPELKVGDWSDLFFFLAREVKVGRVIILLDEISWMGDKDPNFLGKLKNIWDLELKDNPELMLILCGSVSTWIEKNILRSSGFMGRVSLDLVLEELSLSDCNQFFSGLGSRANAYEKFKLLSVMGGVPRYLEEIQPGLSADENLRLLCFTPSGILFREFEDIFHDLFLTKSQLYKKMAGLLVDGSYEFREICEKLSVQKSGFWSEYLSEMIKAGFVKRDFSWDLKTGKVSNMSHFRLSDNYLRFYLKYIEPNKEKIEANFFEENQTNSISALLGWETLMGFQFENLVLNNVGLIWEKLKIQPADIVAHGPFFQRKTAKKRGCQIDYLIKTRYNTLFLCEIKFSRLEVDSGVIDAVNGKVEAISLPVGYSLWPVLIHVNGVKNAIEESGFFTHIIDFSSFLQT